VDVTTQHNDMQRTGATAAEATLTRANVAGLHKVSELVVDPPQEGGPTAWQSQIVAQPLVVSAVGLPDGTQKDLVILCTMHGTVYAFEAGHAFGRVWATWLGQPVQDFFDAAGNVADAKDLHGTNPEWGILSTPVVDPAERRVYVVMWHNDAGGTHRLHVLDLATGQPVRPAATIAGSVQDAHGHAVTFNSSIQKQRPGLLLVKRADLDAARAADVGPEGTLYIAFGASIESSHTYHGWVFAYDAATSNRQAVWCATPNGSGAGVWQSGGGLTADASGAIYLMTGNGDFEQSGENFGESFVRLACSDLSVLSFFTPWYWRALNKDDRDLGSAGPVRISGTDFLIGVGKTGTLYSLDSRNLGGVGNPRTHRNPSIDEVQATGNPPHPNLDHDHHVHGTPAYFAPLSRIYLWGENDLLKAFSIDRATGRLSPHPVATGTVVAPSGMPGGMLSLSSNGAHDAILWAALPLAGDANLNRLVDGILRAFDAESLAELWKSTTAPGNQLGHFAKFASPTVANGHVYVPTYDAKVVVYGV
jgi:outer membrane protein assembly factor BamB